MPQTYGRGALPKTYPFGKMTTRTGPPWDRDVDSERGRIHFDYRLREALVVDAP